MPRANMIGKGSKETPEPEEVEGVGEGNPLGVEDNVATARYEANAVDENGANVKQRRVSKTHPFVTP